MGKPSRDKGKRGEREARDAVMEHWGATDARRTAQSCGSLSADLEGCLPHTHVEVKRYKRITALDFLRQAESDSHGDTPLVLMREDGDTDWVVMFRIKDTRALANRWVCQIEFPENE